LTNLTIIFPHPDPSLNPNKKHGRAWQSSVNAIKKAREMGRYLTLEALGNTVIFKAHEFLKLDIKVYWFKQTRTRRYIDADNFLSSLKHYQDGVFDALKPKFSVNDNQIKFISLDMSEVDDTNPRVEWSLCSI
jgi:hypothetical protein